jgi:hypothetical protein
MRKASEVPSDTSAGNRRKPAPRQSDQRLRRLFEQAQDTTDRHKQAELKEQFIREFYESAR